MNADSLLVTAGRSRACLPRVSRNSCCRAAPQAISMVTSGSTGSCGAWAATSTSAGRERTRKNGNKPRVTGESALYPFTHTPRAEGTRVCVPHRALCLAHSLMHTWTSHWPVYVSVWEGQGHRSPHCTAQNICGAHVLSHSNRHLCHCPRP